ncbi:MULTISPECIES: HAMP domain-containing protein [Streptomyces]|uniref:HAMP domain-containing protein n=1 Tax=Streptomyces koelreuteriae TaxID=2838015 RepID=A0ABX8G539_9ACTN|nr:MULTISPECIES: HAMP domain-containing protein [Streptomyces]QWB28245.1 HAMP domain-containing protein [Streptomyces koelreuteriae]UUA11322.1 HAMP domain-containing protein [Streptomyces koelreuteriae]UUA18922.1 HAMP domain-containing protein [Streptomyces sp. CRCS-T-1]
MPLLGGVRPPIALLCVLVLALAGLTAQVLGPAGEQAVPQAVLSSQQHFAQDGAIALRASIDERVTDLNRTAAALNAGSPVKPERVLSDLGKTYQKWTGTTVLELESGKVLAARGETIPLGWLDKDALTGDTAFKPRMVRLETGDVRLMTMAVLDVEDRPQQLLIASNSLSVPAINLGQFRSMAVVATGGEILATAGFEQSEALNSDQERKELGFLQKQMSGLSAQAARETEQDPVSAREPGSRGYPGVSGTLVGGSYNGRVATAGYASLSSADPEEKKSVGAGLGLTVVALLPVVQQQGAAPGRELYGLLAAGALVVLGLLAAAVLWATVQRPLLRLFLESRRLARGDLTRPVDVPRWGEAARIGSALERLRAQLGGPAGDPGGRQRVKGRFGVRGPLALTAVLLLLWCVPVGLLLNRTDDSVSIPASMVADQRDRTDLVADRVRRALNEAQADLVSTSRLIDPDDAGAGRALLEETLREHTRYQALYLLDEDGEVVARAGGEPRAGFADADELPLVRVAGKGGKKPVVQAGAPLPGDKGMTLVGEVRVEFLNSLLKRPGLGEVRVVDSKAETIAASDGFLAFEELPRDALTDLVRAGGVHVGAGPVENGLLIREGGGTTVAAAAPFSGGGVAADIGWTVVSWQNAKDFQITPYQREDRSVLAGLLGLALIVVCLGWVHLVVARPMRALAAGAEKLADGDLKSVLYPRYQDEVGAVVRSLELLRQQLQARKQTQARRLAEPQAGVRGR